MEQKNTNHNVEHYYSRGEILNSILNALHAMGKDLTHLTPADLAPVDEFHIRGREATIELANRVTLEPGQRVIDVGCGLGGSVRYLADTHHLQATGIDLTTEYIEGARALADIVGLHERVTFRQGNALALPFDPESFDFVWTEHAQMNIADKQAFYAEMARVLVTGGRLVFHDIFQGQGGSLHFPVPWAEESAINFLSDPEVVQKVLEAVGFRILEWEDKSHQSLEWFRTAVERLQRYGPQPLGLHLLMGATAKAKFENTIRNLQEKRIVVIQAIAEKV
jgi:ubiquinone/menaquinone biosynthesis C-methylase UbiE